MVIIPRITFLTPHRHRRRLRISSAIAENTNIDTFDDDVSWFSLDDPALDAFNGWAFPETSISKKTTGSCSDSMAFLVNYFHSILFFDVDGS